MGYQGPLVRRLNSYGPLIGLVVGAFQEGSKDLHALLGTLADSQLRAKGLARGRHHPGWAEKSSQHGCCQGELCLPAGQGVQGGGGAQTGSQKEGLGEEGGGEEGLLACQHQGQGATQRSAHHQLK